MPQQALLHWDAENLWQQLEPELPGLSVEVVHSTLSTNSALLERARAVPDPNAGDSGATIRRSVESGAFGRRAIDLQPCLLVAEHQSAGRGRVGRAWQSRIGASLTFSLGLSLASRDWSGLSLAVGFLLAALSSLKLTSAITEHGLKPTESGTVVIQPGDTVHNLPKPGGEVVGPGVQVGTVYRLPDGRLVYVTPGKDGSGTSGDPGAAP